VKLAAVQSAALRGAEEEADAILRAAHERAERLLAEARAEADALIAQRRAAALRLAEREERERLARARAAARTVVLEAQRVILDEATTAARATVRSLVDDGRYQRLIERVSADARARLAGAGTVEVAAASEGGIVARAGSLQLDYSLDAQTDRCLQAMAGELERLWM
jgi:vacuolar-type H+-ATPase subunit E/Vma4